ncbi:MAG: hypothetical protein AAF546_14855 [Verrucomicrobiota bacterium]
MDRYNEVLPLLKPFEIDGLAMMMNPAKVGSTVLNELKAEVEDWDC